MRLCGKDPDVFASYALLTYYRHIPLNIISVDSSGKSVVNKVAVLEAREKVFELDTSKPFKLNAGNVGVCECLFDPHLMNSESRVPY
jgi:hypothetical protein